MTEAVLLYREAATQNYSPAQFNLALLYLHGTGIHHDPPQGLHLLRVAAEAGNRAALRELAQVYYSGNGIPQDPITAYEWLEIANAKGEFVQDVMKVVADELTAPEIQEATQRAKEWIAQHSADQEKSF